MTRTALLALLSHWRRHPGQSLTLVLGLALATALWSAVQAINAEARASYAAAADTLTGAARASITRADPPLGPADFATLRRAGWPVTPVIEGRLTLGAASLPLTGIDLLSRPAATGARTGDPAPDPAAFLTPPGRLLAAAATAAQLTDRSDLPPVIVSRTVPPGLVLTDIATAARLLNRPDGLDRLDLTGPVPDHAPPLASLLHGAVLATPDAPTDTARLTASFHLNLTAFGLLSFAVGLFVVHGIAGLAFEDRRATFRTLRALGLPLAALTRLVIGELVALALISGLLGLALGYAIAAALLPDVSASLRGLYGADIAGTLRLRPVWVLGGLGMALIGALTAGAQGLLTLRRMPLLASAGRYRWATTARRRARRMALAGIALLLGGGAALIPGGLVAGFAALAGLMLGAALILPALLDSLLTRAAARARGPVAQWVWADMAAQLPGLSLALMALLLALATNIGVGTMVSSFRLTFTGWLDQRLMSEIYVTAPSDAQGAEIAAWLAPRADAVLPIRYADTRIADRPARVYGIADHPTYRDHWPLIAAAPDAWDQIRAGAVLINEQLARSDSLWPGDRVRLGPDWTAPIAGVYSDYGNPAPQAIAALPDLLARYPGIANRRFGIRIAPDRAPALIAALRDRFDLPAEAIADQSTIKAFSLRIFEKTFLVTGALNVLTLGVAAFAILTSLLALWSARLPQLAPAWALGLSRRHLAALEVLRSTGLAALTALLALPVGLALAWVLLAVVNVAAFGWRLPMYLFPGDWLNLFALALLAGAVAALLPARRLMRLPPAHLLKVFADER